MRIIKYRTTLTDSGCVELKTEYCINAPSICRRMNTIESVYSFAVDFLKLNKEPEEYVYMLCLNGHMDLLSIFEISHGTVNCSVVSSREVFQKALLANAVYIILIHNHPSGSPYPSNNDIALTKQLKESGHMMNIELVDHIIVGGNAYISLKEMQHI